MPLRSPPIGAVPAGHGTVSDAVVVVVRYRVFQLQCKKLPTMPLRSLPIGAVPDGHGTVADAVVVFSLSFRDTDVLVGF
jgi:hypothetical protein